MRADDINVLAVLKQALGYHSDRQRVIAENVANANTPGYVPRDVSRSDFERAVEEARGGQSRSRLSVTPVAMRAPHAAHIEGTPAASARQFRTESAPDSETTINGNAVVLEEQMVRANENRMRFETALGLYNKSLSLLRMAVRPPQ
ncbi:flagellar basal body rod protein FlgB [Marinicauda algicola]|uniref:Flagellar basal body rod protein FlgB n=1 Tax=Marinicauda algicola TaxID=2029849 RepID=A0A4S2H3R0_9PROT|nr:flagellar basal body rod protein FlgB [Marinicauda algicola]TGY90008.1 flagellar basal body rod protein FlgB [Marinicauda algicola]